jgi:hypothetical protein
MTENPNEPAVRAPTARRASSGSGRAGFGWIGIFLVFVFAAGLIASPYGQRLIGVNFGDLYGLGEDREQADAALQSQIATLQSALDDLRRQLELQKGDLQALRVQAATAQESNAAERARDFAAVRTSLAEANADVTNLGAAMINIAGELREQGEIAGVVAVLERRIADIEDLQSVAQTAETGAANLPSLEVADLRGRIDGLSARIDSLEAETMPENTAAQLAALRADIESLEAAMPEGLANIATTLSRLEAAAATRVEGTALLAAVMHLSEQVGTGAPYQTAFTQLKILVDAAVDAELSASLSVLSSAAATGIPSLADLRSEFASLAGTVVHAGRIDADSGWLDRTFNRVTSVVTVRRTGEVTGSGSEAIMARAEARLAAGDLKGAIAEIDSLDGETANQMSGWRGRADLRFRAHQAVDQLTLGAMQRLGAS